jgi:protocatechuate 3,4-dioxygenase beta subunit
MNPDSVFGAVAAFCCVCILAACMQDGPSTETGNPNLSGTLVDGQGRPVPGEAKLYLLPPPPGGGLDTAFPAAPRLIDSSRVGRNGRFRFDSVAPGTYAVEGRDLPGAAFGLARDLLIARPEDILTRNVTLAAPGRIRGLVTRGPNPRPAGIVADEKILVRLDGADRSALTDTSGAFALNDVPAGSYRVAFAAADGHYLTRYVDGVAVAAGAETALAPVELEWSRYGAPPAVGGLSVALDSAAGLARLSWRAAKLSGGATVVYAIERGGIEIARTADTLWVDSLAGVAPGTALRYAVRAINPLGQAGPADTLAAGAAPDGNPPAGEGVLEGLVLQGNAPVTGARVELHLAPAGPGSPDSLPLRTRLLDSLVTGADGRYRFPGLGQGRFVVIARRLPGADIAMARASAPRRGGAGLDTLRPAAPGSVAGFATRDSLWITSPFKGDENIQAGLAGTPFTGLTGFGFPPTGGAFSLAGVPAGEYILVLYAPPEGYFLPDSIAVTVRAGEATKLPATVKARYNPSAPPPRIASLRSTGATRARVSLAWDAVARYPLLRGYRVMRLSETRTVLDSSAVLASAAYSDDVSAVPAGTKLGYVVRVVGSDGREGPNGGDASGLPVMVTVPGP